MIFLVNASNGYLYALSEAIAACFLTVLFFWFVCYRVNAERPGLVLLVFLMVPCLFCLLLYSFGNFLDVSAQTR